MSGEHFSLVWNTFPRNLSSGLYSLLTDEQLVDVTLAAEGQILRAHKLILSVCSTYFRDLFKGNTCKHPIVILKDVNYRDLSAMLHFMYQGEVNIKQEDIASFLKVAEILKIKGLTRTSDDDDESERDLVDALPLIQHEYTKNASASQASHTPEPFCEPSNNWSNPCQCSSKIPKDDVSVKTFRDSTDSLISENLSHSESRDIINPTCQTIDEEPLDCSASLDDNQKIPADFPEYKPKLNLISPEIKHLSPEVECIQRSIGGTSSNLPHNEQENMDTVLNAQQMIYSTSHCQSDSVGFRETGTTCASDFSHDPSSSCSGSGGTGGIGGSNSASKGRRTVKGLPGSSLSLETTLRVISELGPTIRMERGKVIRMYSCPWCLRHFTRKENLKLHVRYIHGPLESLTCKLCGNKYKNSNSLRVHSYLYHNAQRNKSSATTSASSGSNKPSVVGGNA
ncbi:PREDICTED: broad-complex core protein isoforms 1/2/3/4/5-like [Ceratosolen solmsi marchali]|uniref:Broad-complex core protein isoforms 1/2/3/4/5-like n=1 Tax=Ceratosolen solmsi marchali TaxID=326594 RepID=A0AAJ6VLC9_9HYME|nr:PREDICTED: broad-complex core protein isoforms 1/2/3/4/5-like [Ceratosolen solmsi marchali]